MKRHVTQLYSSWILFAIAGLLIFTSCKKEELDKDDGTNAEFDFDVDMGFGSQSDNIPSGATIIIDQIIVDDNYSHMYQKSPGINCGTTACLPTSYLMARQILQPTWDFTEEEVNNLRERMHTSCGGVYLDYAADLAKEDFGACNPGKFKKKSTSNSPGSDEGRTATKEKIKEWVEKEQPLIARLEVSSNGSISESNAYTHFVVIVGLTLTDVGTGSTVYYIDPLRHSAEVLDCSYTRFLNSMKSENGYYYLLPIGC